MTESFMREALDLARRGAGRVEPNPLVGALVVRDGRVLGRGHHAVYGGEHAERAALSEAGAAARGATVHVTLEPCGHQGKTPPCAEALVGAGVRRVMFAAADPNPVTAGRGPEILREAGIEVDEGPLSAEARALNSRYERHLGSALPWTIAKWAMTLDGKIADVDLGSRFITGSEARGLAHEVRSAVDAIVVGVGTVLADDPELTAREGTGSRVPTRVILDSVARTPIDRRVVRTAGEIPTWIICGEGADPGRVRALEVEGCRMLRMPMSGDGLDLDAVFRGLKENGVGRLLLEGGGRIHAAALAAGVVHQVMAFVAPIVLGGREAPTPVAGDGFRRIGDALRLADQRVSRLGEDVLVEGYVE